VYSWEWGTEAPSDGQRQTAQHPFQEQQGQHTHHQQEPQSKSQPSFLRCARGDEQQGQQQQQQELQPRKQHLSDQQVQHRRNWNTSASTSSPPSLHHFPNLPPVPQASPPRSLSHPHQQQRHSSTNTSPDTLTTPRSDTPSLPQHPPSDGHYVCIDAGILNACPLPAFSSTRLILHAQGQPPMWVWNVSAWRLSQALAARDRSSQSHGGRSVGRCYRSGAPLRRKRLRRWWEAPQVVQPPAPPSVWRPAEWAAMAAADQAQAQAQEDWQRQEHRQLPQEHNSELENKGTRARGMPQGSGKNTQLCVNFHIRPATKHRQLQQRRQKLQIAIGRELTSKEDWDWKV